MPRARQSRGACACCGAEIGGKEVARHLSSCPGRQAMIETAGRKQGGKESLYHLWVQDSSKKEFWLHLEMRGSATLKALDSYLRHIWLECCGHMSQFSIGGWDGEEIPMSRKAREVFEPGLVLTHIYDFGTESETLIEAMSVREGRPTTNRPIALLARNLMPEWPCIECGRPAALLCEECLVEEGKWGALCEEHGASHPHDNYGDPTPLVNSPRLGLCGYDGPADPPY